MSSFLDNIPQLPLDTWVENGMDWLTDTFSGLFKLIQDDGKELMNSITDGLLFIPPVLFILIVAVLAFFVTGKNPGFRIWKNQETVPSELCSGGQLFPD